MTDNTMREAFEKWAESKGYRTDTYTEVPDDYWDDTTQSAWRAWQAARTVPEGWRIDRCSDGSINVIRYGAGGANVEQNAKQARHIPEEVLWMLANDMLSAAPEGKK